MFIVLYIIPKVQMAIDFQAKLHLFLLARLKHHNILSHVRWRTIVLCNLLRARFFIDWVKMIERNSCVWTLPPHWMDDDYLIHFCLLVCNYLPTRLPVGCWKKEDMLIGSQAYRQQRLSQSDFLVQSCAIEALDHNMIRCSAAPSHTWLRADGRHAR